MNEQPIGRYIAIAFIFVLLFIGVAYLAYRFSRPAGTQTGFPTASPTPTTQPSTGGGTVVLLPPPSAQAINPYIPANRIYASPQPVVTKAPTTLNNAQNPLIIYDGKGNILVNNLTHDEYFQLEREKLQTQRELALAQANNATRVNEAKIQQDAANRTAQTQLETSRAQAAQQAQTQQFAYLTERDRINQQVLTSQQNYQLELARLQNELRLEKLQAENSYRTSVTQQAYELAKLRNNLYYNQTTAQPTTGYQYY